MIYLDHNNQHLFLFIILNALSGYFIFSQDKMNEEINKIRANEKFENIKAAADKKELHNKIENNNKADIKKNDDIDILAIKDEITRKQLLALLNIIKETASPEVYQQQKKAVVKTIQKHEKLSLLLKEKINSINKNDSSLADEHFFMPQEPKQLSSDAKKIHCIERIKNKFIGEIPGQVQLIIDYLDKNQIKKNTPISNLILLHGEPGMGKNVLVKSIAQELEVALMYIPAGVLTDKFHGESQRRVGRLFDIAKMYVHKYNKPIILFIDEIDAITATREGPVQPEHRQTLTRLLTELQDLRDNKSIFAFVATNDFKNLDRAVKDRFNQAICEIKVKIGEKAALIRSMFKEYGKDIDKYCAEILVYTMRDVGDISNRGIENIIKMGIAEKEMDCEKHPENCNLHEFYYIWKKLKEREGLFTYLCSHPYNPGIYFIWIFENSFNYFADPDHDFTLHEAKDSIFGCSQCFYNKTNNSKNDTSK